MDRLTFLGGLVAAVGAPAGPTYPPLELPTDRPLEWKLRVLDGPDFVLSRQKGRAVFVTFFATWCGPCRAEQPTFVDFAGAYASDTVVLGVDVNEPDDEVRAWRKRFGVPYALGMDEGGSFHRALVPARVLPTTIVFTPAGYLGSWWYGATGRRRLEIARANALGLPVGASTSAPDEDDGEVFTPGMKPSPTPSRPPS